ncbi:MAG: cold shock domain-containing protein [Methylococcales symbiont of Hymedesmia sp. n. MRB-2018]|nr:MAG: cold shock domain-containing protein [Methylococcales symbiont of Hymedesmia sp. n. MRB-2018]KAF3982827.1 MAG: cold shock domain-containing protein [Methylococcales symbiont of Hymedesmia sp. n. MRB-2018]
MEEKNKGFLKTWKDDRGFGFIKPDDDSDDVFIHISALGEGARRPHRGDTIFYQIEETDDGKTKAVNAYIDGEKNLSKKSNTWIWIALSSIGVAGVAAAVILLGA